MHIIAGYNQSKNVRINLLSCMRIHSATLQDMTFIAAFGVFSLRFVTFFSSWSWAVLGHLYSHICFTENLVMTFGLIFGLAFAGTFDRMSFLLHGTNNFCLTRGCLPEIFVLNCGHFGDIMYCVFNACTLLFIFCLANQCMWYDSKTIFSILAWFFVV